MQGLCAEAPLNKYTHQTYRHGDCYLVHTVMVRSELQDFQMQTLIDFLFNWKFLNAEIPDLN